MFGQFLEREILENVISCNLITQTFTAGKTWSMSVIKGEEIKKYWTGIENFDKRFCAILNVITKVLFMEGRLGTRLYLHSILTFF